MKKKKLIIPIILLILFTNVKSKFTNEQPINNNSIKKVKIILELDEKGYPFGEESNKIFKAAGFKVVDIEDKDFDLTVRIQPGLILLEPSNATRVYKKSFNYIVLYIKELDKINLNDSNIKGLGMINLSDSKSEYNMEYLFNPKLLALIEEVYGVDPLITFMKDATIDSKLKFNVFMALFEIIIENDSNNSANEVLIVGLKDNNKYIREFSRDILALKADKQTIKGLIPLLKDENPNLRDNVIYILKKITNEDFGQDPVKWDAWWSNYNNDHK